MMIAVFLTLSSVAGFFHFGVLYYIMLATTGFMYLLQPSFRLRMGEWVILLFLFACAMSLIVNDVPKYFNSTNRFIVYTLVLIVVSPLITNEYIGPIRSKLFFYSLVVLSILSVGSFFAFYLGVNMFVRLGTELEIGSGTFSGLMNHSMVLGPFSAISAIYLLSLVFTETKKTKRLFFILSFLCCLGACFFAASRISLLGVLCGCVVVVIRYYRGRMSKAIVVLLLVAALAAASFPIWGGVMDLVLEKQEFNEQLGGALYSREGKIAARILEFKSSPIFGIGFCSVDPRYDVVQFDNGQIEPGTSWLAILSMTGILGLIAFIPICVIAFRQIRFIESIRISCALLGILVFYLIHMLAEGYIMAPRSFLNMFFWLLLGTINGEYERQRFEKE